MNLSRSFIATLDGVYEKIDSRTLDQARRCFIDYVGVAVAGGSVVDGGFKSEILSFKGDDYVFGSRQTVDLMQAVFFNAYVSHILELDDGHRAAMMHIGAPVFSAMLNIAADRALTLERFLKGAVIGYEAAIRLAQTIQPEHKKNGFHATGTCGTIGAAMAIAYLLDYTTEEKLNVLSTACTSAAGLLEVIMGKSQQKPYNIANASVSGVQAALIGKYFAGPEDILGGNRGFINNFSKKPKIQHLTDDCDPKIFGIYLKPYAACRHCHAPIEAAIKCDIVPADLDSIESVDIYTYDLAVFGHDHKEYDSVNSAKMSIPYGVACGLLYNDCGINMFTPEALADTKIKNLSLKVQVHEDEELSKLVPEKRSAKIIVRLSDGKEYDYHVVYPLGEPENPITDDALSNKFTVLLGLNSCYNRIDSQKLFEYLSDTDIKTEMTDIITEISK